MSYQLGGRMNCDEKLLSCLLDLRTDSGQRLEGGGRTQSSGGIQGVFAGHSRGIRVRKRAFTPRGLF